MNNPLFALVGGLLGLAGLLPFTPMDWPAVAPITAAIVGAVVLGWRHVSRSPAAADPPAGPAGDAGFPRVAA